MPLFSRLRAAPIAIRALFGHESIIPVPQTSVSAPIQQQDAAFCGNCYKSFSPFRRRHHCHGCGIAICRKHTMVAPWAPKKVRMCDGCVHQAFVDNFVGGSVNDDAKMDAPIAIERERLYEAPAYVQQRLYEPVATPIVSTIVIEERVEPTTDLRLDSIPSTDPRRDSIPVLMETIPDKECVANEPGVRAIATTKDYLATRRSIASSCGLDTDSDSDSESVLPHVVATKGNKTDCAREPTKQRKQLLTKALEIESEFHRLFAIADQRRERAASTTRAQVSDFSLTSVGSGAAVLRTPSPTSVEDTQTFTPSAKLFVRHGDGHAVQKRSQTTTWFEDGSIDVSDVSPDEVLEIPTAQVNGTHPTDLPVFLVTSDDMRKLQADCEKTAAIAKKMKHYMERMCGGVAHCPPAK